MSIVVLIIILVALLGILFLTGNGMGINNVPAIVKLCGFIVALIVALIVILQASGITIPTA